MVLKSFLHLPLNRAVAPVKVGLRKLRKLLQCIRVSGWRGPLVHGVAAATEHDPFFARREFDTVVDVGANKGQFSLVMRKNYPAAHIFAFEPLRQPFQKYCDVFKDDSNVTIVNSALARQTGIASINVSQSSDSSSLLEITDLQEEVFPGTSAVSTEEVNTGPLSSFIRVDQIQGAALLKLDVQGFELEVLRSCEEFLPSFDMVYCECSFLELYKGQALAPDVIEFMRSVGFVLQGFNNVAYDEQVATIQADFIFVQTNE